MTPPEDSPSVPANAGRGFLMVIEGIDGTGKSTLCAALEAELKRRGIDCVRSREPTDGPHGRKIREIALSGRDHLPLDEELRLFIEDRKEHVAQVLRPNLEAGRVVLLDRYFYSTMAYQGARGADPAAIRKMNRAFAPEADLLVILELDVENALQRVRESRGSIPDAFEGEEYLQEVDAVFRSIEHRNLLRLDARKTTDELVGQILERLPRRFRGA